MIFQIAIIYVTKSLHSVLDICTMRSKIDFELQNVSNWAQLWLSTDVKTTA